MDHQEHTHAPYKRLLLMIGISFVLMYILMYSMVATIRDVYHSFNQAYMAGLMVAPMLILEVLLMGMMYPNKKANLILITGGLVIFVFCFLGIRSQAGIHDQQFLRSMIPHHSGALLMCEKASLSDPELLALCDSIRESQQQEIDFMRTKLLP